MFHSAIATYATVFVVVALNDNAGSCEHGSEHSGSKMRVSS
jgi:hypothetical protein